MIRPLPVIAGLLVLVASGIANGIWNDRWAVSHELEDMTERLPKVPMRIGVWVAQDDDPKTATTDEERERREKKRQFTRRLKQNGTLHELLSRIYVNQNTGDAVEVLMATGRPGPIATHNPLTCIGDGSGYPVLVQPKPVTLETSEGTAVFTRADFGGKDAYKPGLRVFWAWHDRDKGWVSADDPRTAFASYRALTKIYVTRSLPPGTPPARGLGKDPLANFIRDCMPTIDAVLFKPADQKRSDK
jgi:hypothetical protein